MPVSITFVDCEGFTECGVMAFANKKVLIAMLRGTKTSLEGELYTSDGQGIQGSHVSMSKHDGKGEVDSLDAKKFKKSSLRLYWQFFG